MWLLEPSFRMPSLSESLSYSLPFVISGFCGWAAWSLLKNGSKPVLVAPIVWLVMGAITIYFEVTEVRVQCPLNLLATMLLAITEIGIAVHLIQRRHEPAT